MSWLMHQADRHPLLTPAEELSLAATIQRWRTHAQPVPRAIERAGLRARARFAAANIRLVYHVFRAYSSMARGYEDDAIQAGMMGLLRAIDKFDPKKGYKFSTYAFWWVRQGIQRFTRSEMLAIRLPHEHATKRKQLLAAEARLAEELGRVPTDAELASALGWYQHLVDPIRRPPTCTHSIDYQLTSDGNDLFLCDVLTDGLPDDVSIDQVVEAMELLPVVQRQILRAIYLDLESPSRRQLAERLGIDRNRITDLERQAIRTLQHLLTSPPDSPGDSQPVQRRRHRRTIDRQAIEHRAAQPC